MIAATSSEGTMRVNNSGQHGPKAALVLGTGRRDRDAAVRTAVKRTEEADDVLAPGDMTAELDRGFHRLRSGVGEKGSGLPGHRRDGVEASAHLHVDRQIEVRRRVVQKTSSLRRHCLGHIRMS